MPDLPEGILNALTLFETSFGNPNPQDQVRTFKNAIYLTNDCMDEFHRYREDIQAIRYGYTLRLFTHLRDHATTPDYESWLEFVLLLCIDLRPEIQRLHDEAPRMFDDLLAFLSLYDESITPELKTNITRFIADIIGQSPDACL